MISGHKLHQLFGAMRHEPEVFFSLVSPGLRLVGFSERAVERRAVGESCLSDCSAELRDLGHTISINRPPYSTVEWWGVHMSVSGSHAGSRIS